MIYNNYVCYHLHDDLSLLDSCTKSIDYINKAKELGQTAIAFTNHGNIYNWLIKKKQCDSVGIKYIHGVEIYLTQSLLPKVRDNYHTILLAKNQEGIFEINKLMELSTRDDHFYYKPRISFEEFLDLSDNIIKISACLASPLNKIRDEEILKDLLNKYDYYEIQFHNNGDQIEYNKYLFELSKKYHKPLIAGTDTHSLNKYKAECRSILQKAKGIEYADEDSFDLTYKSYDELIEMAKIQNALPLDICIEAINNTNIIASQIEDFKIDGSVKYPILYGSKEKDNDKFIETLKRKTNDKIKNGIIVKDKKYLTNIKEEMDIFNKTGMNGFMLFMSELITWCKENGIPIGFARGSVAGSTIAYLLDITDVDPIKWNTIFSRFCNEDRAKGETGDIDIDASPTQRTLIYDYIINRFGQEYTAYVLALGTVVDKGCIDEIGRALSIPLNEVAKIKTEYEENQNKTREKYPNVFYYFDGILNTYISQSVHPAGIIACPLKLSNNYGTFWSKDKQILCIDMECCHDLNLAKYDILGLKNIEIIKNTCELANIKYPLSNEIDWEDKKVWQDTTCSNVGLFQFESNFAFESLKKMNCNNIDDLSLCCACIRPSGESYRNKVFNNECNTDNPSKIIDDMLKSTKGYLVYQEQTIEFLQKICGLSGTEADNIRRAIGRKQLDRLELAMPSILEGYCNKSNSPREVAEKEVEQFLTVISDSASYQFGFNHTTAYSMITYLCAMLRYYYPLEFTCAYLINSQTMEDLKQGYDLATVKNITIHDIMFGKSKAQYFIDYNSNAIYKGVSSIKYLNEIVANELYNLSQTNAYNSFPLLLQDILTNTSCNSKQLTILIKLDYFSMFGKAQKLLSYVDLYNEFYGKKTINKTKEYSIPMETIKLYCGKETEKQLGLFNFELLLQDEWNKLPNNDISLNDRLETEIEYLGYLTYTNPKLDNTYMVTSFETPYSKSKPTIEMYNLSNGQTIKCKIKDDRKFDNNSFGKNSFIKIPKKDNPMYAPLQQQYRKKRLELTEGLDAKNWSKKEIAMKCKWIDGDSLDWILMDWEVIKK